MSALNRVVADLKAFGLQYVRNPFGAVFSIAFPIILLSVFGAIFSPSGSAGAPDVHVVIQDLDGTALSGRFYEAMEQAAANQAGEFYIYPTEPDYDMSQEIIEEYDLTAAVVVPAGFEAATLDNGPAQLGLWADESTRSYEIIVAAVEEAIGTLEGDPAVAGQAVGIETTDIAIGEGFVFIDFFLPGVISAGVMINCLMILSSLMADYWAHGYFKILKTTPLKKWEWILSKLIWYVLVNVIAVALMMALGILVFGARASVTPMAVALVLAGILLFSSIGILIGAWGKNSDTAAGISQAIGQPMLWLSGIFWRLEELPKFVQTISKALPLTYLGRGLRETMVNSNDAAALKDLVVVVVLAAGFFAAASMLISWKEK